jgi:hypothetical protein
MAEGKELYAVNEPSRYGFDNTYAEVHVVRQRLSAGRKWLVSMKVLPVELHFLMVIFTDIVVRLEDSKVLLDYFLEKGPDSVVKVEDVTTPWTKEVGEGEECCICRYTFGPEYSDENITEPAVKTVCGHVLGTQCVQQWIEGHNTCPVCRQPLFGLERSLPAAVQPLYHSLKKREAEFRRLEPIADEYFLREPSTCYGKRMGRLLEDFWKLSEIIYNTVVKMILLAGPNHQLPLHAFGHMVIWDEQVPDEENEQNEQNE